MAEKTKRILIVDDSQEILNTYNEFFNTMGYDVSIASDGLAALKILQNTPKPFDLLITDLVMPKISGVGLISIIKEAFENLKIIAVTGFGEEPGSLAIEAKADIILYKPVDLFEMEKTVEKLIKDSR